MSAGREGGSSPAEVAALLAGEGRRLLRKLAEPETIAIRNEGKLSLRRSRKGVSMPAGQMPAAALAPLLSSGAVACRTRNGKAEFFITEAGRARLFREAAGDDPFGDQHRLIETRQVETGGEHHPVRANLKEDTLELLARQRDGHGAALIGAAERDAGRRLSRDIALARMTPQVTLNWSRLVVDGGGRGDLSLSESAMEARWRVGAALNAAGPDFAGLLIDLCGFSKGLVEIEAGHGFPVRSGKIVIALALRALARHYGLSNAAHGPEPSGRITQWGAEGYRPRLEAG